VKLKDFDQSHSPRIFKPDQAKPDEIKGGTSEDSGGSVRRRDPVELKEIKPTE